MAVIDPRRRSSEPLYDGPDFKTDSSVTERFVNLCLLAARVKDLL
jgi:hypothetical protein